MSFYLGVISSSKQRRERAEQAKDTGIVVVIIQCGNLREDLLAWYLYRLMALQPNLSNRFGCMHSESPLRGMNAPW